MTGHPLASSSKLKAAPRLSIPTPRSVDSPVTGLTLDHKYRLLKKIGAGGMGAVYEAESIGFGRRVAVKISKEKADARLQREAEVIAALHHPNICAAYDSGRTPWGSAYVVLERLYGETLGQRLARGPLPDGEIIDVVLQLLSGLHAAHQNGIVHRDVKPENVFLERRDGLPPLVKILDFGFARDFSGSRDLTNITKTGWICGTLDYMAPEQMIGSAVGPPADLFSVGVLLFVALTRRAPFGSDVKRNVIHSRALRLSRLRPDLPSELDAVLRRALENHPSRRFASAIELQEALVAAWAQRAPQDLRTTLERPAFDLLPRLFESSNTNDSSTIPSLGGPPSSGSSEVSPA